VTKQSELNDGGIVSPAVTESHPELSETVSEKRDVLVTDDFFGQAGRGPLAAVRALSIAGYRPSVAFSSATALAAASRHCVGRIRVPPAESEAFAPALRQELERNEYLTVFPGSDVGLMAVGGSHLHLLDKAVLAEAGAAAGMAVPPSRVFNSPEELLDEARHLDFPVVIKPTRSHDSITARSPEDLEWWRGRNEPLLMQPYLRDQLRAIAGVAWRGRLVAVLHQHHLRTWNADPGGPASAAQTVEPDLELEKKMLRLLSGYDGIFMAELRGEYLLDLNLRIYASLALAIKAGVNIPSIYCDLLRGESVDLVRARPGVFYRWLDGDVRSVIWAAYRKRMTVGEAVKALIPRRGAAHGGPESLADPRPMLARLRQGVQKLRDPSA
jgi:hypothetical protein